MVATFAPIGLTKLSLMRCTKKFSRSPRGGHVGFNVKDVDVKDLNPIGLLHQISKLIPPGRLNFSAQVNIMGQIGNGYAPVLNILICHIAVTF
ncbi:hypothetical protein IFM89_018502 [Coptis chinensis]|uniref:Uncharacterized protein n=1 Tax=Coptis chinensis TaxID=261450 RepID=A0A835IP16_9MAGN|nr:hypothetical protein IFM89_018502 [Coptis chinensis]